MKQALQFSIPVLLFTCTLLSCKGQQKTDGTVPGNRPHTNPASSIMPGAAQLELYLPTLKGKNVGVFANQTSTIGDRHLVDVLKEKGVNVTVIFGPEHGFRGTADAGEKVESTIDKATGIPVVSLYGKKRIPSAEDLKNVDIMLFDVQDVGVRFYTYISSLQEYLETAIIHNKPLLVLDRPNPNGHYVDGPVLETKYKSFVGMQPIPVVYGMTIGEYAKMILEEGWLSEQAMQAYTQNVLAAIYPPGASYFRLEVIPCKNYTHSSFYELPVKPSPNLPNLQSIYWYPSTCFFEGTVLSEGRGTDKPFQVFGHPSLPKSLYSFRPTSREGAKDPKLKDQLCYGWDLSGSVEEVRREVDGMLHLKFLIEAYRLFPDKENFFIRPRSRNMDESFFNKLAGNATLMKQIVSGLDEEQIRKSWQPQLENFKKIRAKYLLYPDFK